MQLKNWVKVLMGWRICDWCEGHGVIPRGIRPEYKADSSCVECKGSGVTPKEDEPSDNYFGRCPQCDKNDGYLNVGRSHWFVCDRHRIKWCAGANLFSSWRWQDEQEWRENAKLLATYREITSEEAKAGE